MQLENIDQGLVVSDLLRVIYKHELQKVQLMWRPSGMKFDESNPLLRTDLHCHNNVHIGKCYIMGEHWILEHQAPELIDDVEYPRYFIVLAFIELEGKLGRIRFKEIFCVIGAYGGRRLTDKGLLFAPVVDTEKKIIPLFWPGGFQEYTP